MKPKRSRHLFMGKSGLDCRFMLPTPTLILRLILGKADSGDTTEDFTLKSSDDSYKRTISTDNPSQMGDGFIELVFRNLKTKQDYTLEVSGEDSADSHVVFENVPFKELRAYYSMAEKGDRIAMETGEDSESSGSGGPIGKNAWAMAESWGGDPDVMA